ncbi:MAG TPA: NAD-dependent epimerase/dehydratase family protein [Jiangellales bacterium]|nr:NAD-dependent epimerase/dehydratase family protein [Jiangellales bacterium]
MGGASGGVRAGRNRAGRRTGAAVGVVGAASGAGRMLAVRLQERPEVRRVVAVDASRGDVAGVTWRVLDPVAPGLVTALSGLDTVVHTLVDVTVTDDPVARGRRSVRSTQAVLTAAAAAGVPHVVVVTSAMVYGAHPDNPVPIPEDAPLRAAPDGALLSDLLEVEALVRRSRGAHPGTAVTVVRPAMLVGPGVDTVLTRHFEAPRLLVVKGTAPLWQLCHVDDLASALELLAVGGLHGPDGPPEVVTVGCEGWLAQDEVERLSGLARLELPAVLAFATAERLHRVGLTPAPASELSYLAHPWVVPSTRLREAGWRPEHDNETALEELLELVEGHRALGSRRLGRRTRATLGAAGATVTVLGSAAVVRRARRQRRR